MTTALLMEEVTDSEPTPTLTEEQELEQALLAAFLVCRGRWRGPVIAINERTMITNRSASELLQSGDRRLLWQWVLDVLHDRRAMEGPFSLHNGLTVTGYCKFASSDSCGVGAIVRLSVEVTKRRVSSSESGVDKHSSQARLDPSLVNGWIELTDSERSVAELVARGLTNKEAGREMFVSHHTVDSHLRQVFRKLGVSSRVELARAVGEHYEALASR